MLTKYLVKKVRVTPPLGANGTARKSLSMLSCIHSPPCYMNGEKNLHRITIMVIMHYSCDVPRSVSFSKPCKKQ